MASKKNKIDNLKPFAPGQSGNPGGKTSAQRKMEIENAERATRIRGRFLEALEGLMLEHPEKETLIEERLTGEVLRLIKESEDRGLGTPKQSLDIESPNGTMTPKGVPDDVRAALDAIAGKIAGGNKPGEVAGDGET
jgi:hypothetical protein